MRREVGIKLPLDLSVCESSAERGDEFAFGRQRVIKWV
jgi:hypothetical protein